MATSETGAASVAAVATATVADPATAPAVEWTASGGLVDYAAAVSFMEARAQAIADGRSAELVWLLEHPAIYTAGTSAHPDELIAGSRLPVFQTGRGGRYAYHGPGQRVIYVMLDVKKRGGDVRSFVARLEDWIIATLARLGVDGARRTGRVGVWVQDASSPSGEAKIAAIGLRLRRWVSLHGISLNVSCDLAHYDGIVPCGITGHGVTSLAALKRTDEIGVVDRSLREAFEARFGPTRAVDPPSMLPETPPPPESPPDSPPSA
jgi:lipoyl(octanoyl) transferase